MADPVVVATVDDLQRAVEEAKRTVRKAKREIIEDAHPAREAERRREPTGERSNPRRFTTTTTAIARSSRARASPRDRAMHCCRSLELVEPLWRVAEFDEIIYSKMDIVRASGGKRPPVTGHFI